MPVAVGTKSGLERIVRPFELVVSKGRKFAPSAGMVPAIVSAACDNWQESSTGDSMHKAILVLEGQDFSYVLAARAKEAGESEILRQLFRTFSLMCRDWFANSRILWLPSANSDELRLFISHVRGNLSGVTVAEACKACKLAPRTLRRLSQQELSFGLKTLITEVRMIRAMELLVPGDLSVGAVASSVDFTSLGSFTSAFSQRVGVLRGEFKQKNAASHRSCRALIS